jgi:2-C-methyl-D-erythritol 4-phosphate cytidylyltransferase/2-C-methyl-D-erythritol 2,4-cyclodiphosphate synthase
MDSSAKDVGVVVVAAGSSNRMGGARPKIWLELGGASVLERSLATVAGLATAASLVIVARQDVAAADSAVARAFRRRPPARVVIGGAERADSVRAGLAALAPAAKLVLVHDAAPARLARPLRAS